MFDDGPSTADIAFNNSLRAKDNIKELRVMIGNLEQRVDFLEGVYKRLIKHLEESAK